MVTTDIRKFRLIIILGLAVLMLTGAPFRFVGAAPNEGRVTEVFLKADDAHPSGPCAMTVTFGGSLTTNGPATVKYTFTRSDGATAPTYTLQFKKAGTQPVSTSWTLGDAKTLPAYEGWQAIKILSPNVLESSHETGRFSLTCSDAGKGSEFDVHEQ